MHARIPAAVALVAALVLAPLRSAAEPAVAPPPDAGAPAADWSFGAGVGFEGTLAPGVIGGVPSPSVQIPVVNASLERRLSGRTWLTLGVAGTLQDSRTDVAEGDSGVERSEVRQGFVSVGLRRALSRAGAPVEVSGLVQVEGGLADADQRLVSPASRTHQDVTVWFAGVGAGLAVERELTSGLSLRVASPLLGAWYERSRAREGGGPAADEAALSVRVLLAPRLELRLAF